MPLPIPFLIPLFCHSILPRPLVSTTFLSLPTSFTSLISTPQWGLYYGVCAIMLPCGLKVAYGFTKIPPFQLAYNNINPRKSFETLKATDAFYNRLCSAEAHSFENAPFYIAGVLSAISMKVEPKLITEYCGFWIALRLLHTATYLGAWGNSGVAVAGVRTVSYVMAASASASLLLHAAQASTA
ncbi:hypothetical protein TrLO_g6872 [Triparma laevis f. longispina]|uniref:Uncharacterized protein n=1 Tax=Triparma laevis f. longispina TaxID=1714387 RepID=A0A9W7BYX5_9STRA|nr:hypothetical protein TrLO_g6872 [Triparma laevis f. longispina]